MAKLLVAIGVVLLTSIANAKTWNLNEVVQNAGSIETKDLVKILSDINLEPTKKSASGRPLFLVKKVATGSVYEKAGVRAGDFVVMESAGASKKMELKSSLKESNPDSEAGQ